MSAISRKKHFERGRYAARDFISTSEVSDNVRVSGFESFMCDLDNNGPSQSGLGNGSTSTSLPGYSWIKDKSGPRDIHNPMGKLHNFYIYNFNIQCFKV